MTDEELAAIRERIDDAWELPGGFDDLYGVATTVVSEDIPALLAEVERLREREAALVAVVERVAEADNSDMSVCYQLCSYDMHWTDDDRQVTTHNAPCVVEQARALITD